MVRTLKEKLSRLYNTPDLPNTFFSVSQQWKYAKLHYPSIIKREVQKWLSSGDEYCHKYKVQGSNKSIVQLTFIQQQFTVTN